MSPLSTTTSLGVSILEEQATHGPAESTHDCLPGVFAGLSNGLVEEIGAQTPSKYAVREDLIAYHPHVRGRVQ